MLAAFESLGLHVFKANTLLYTYKATAKSLAFVANKKQIKINNISG